MPIQTADFNDCVTYLHEQLGNQWLAGTPLGIGKPNPLLNYLYQYVKQNPNIKMSLFTALSLEVPTGDSLLERRFLAAFSGRHFKDYPNLDYIEDMKSNTVPENIHLQEFYFQSGQFLKTAYAQQNYISCNYTLVARDMVNQGINVIFQMVAVDRSGSTPRYSLSSNPDLTFDVIRIAKEKNRAIPKVIAMVNEDLPFLEGEAEVTVDFFAVLVDNSRHYFPPYAPPARSIALIDHCIGLHAATLIADNGTLQIGIGSLADAVVYSCGLREHHNRDFLAGLNALGVLENYGALIAEQGGTQPFAKGLFAASEMFVEGFMHLYRDGILKRLVYPDAAVQQLLNRGKLSEDLSTATLTTLVDHKVIAAELTAEDVQRLQLAGIMQTDTVFTKNQLYNAKGKKLGYDLNNSKHLKAITEQALNPKLTKGAVLHASFFLGSKRFYQFLRELTTQERTLFQMTPVSQINQLYGSEAIDRAQRINARFINACMKVDLTGAAVSDTLKDHQVVSGVGGQYNFVAMAHALQHSRSILMLRSSHGSGKNRESNIVWQYPECTIPRHLRDIVVTEYGFAELRGMSDEVCIQRLICIADKAFQEDLRVTAVKHGKLKADWRIPPAHQDNSSERLKLNLKALQNQGLFPAYPFGHDFTEQELRLTKALIWLKKSQSGLFSKVRLIVSSLSAHVTPEIQPLLALMQMDETSGFNEKLMRRLLIKALNETA